MEGKGRDEVATEPPFQVVRKAGAGPEFRLFRKIRRTWKKIRHLLLGEVYKVCQTVASLPLRSTELFVYPEHARRRQTDAKVHGARERVTDTDLRLTVNGGAGRTLLGLLAEAVGASGRIYLWEESSARHGEGRGNCDCDSHVLLSRRSTSMCFLPNMMQMPYAG